MKTTSTSQGATPQNYVQELHLRSPIASKVYCCILNGFQRFVAEQVENKSVSEETIRHWLNDRIQVWSFHSVTHHARLVDRFLSWMVNKGALANNPFADLRTKYGQRKTKPVVRALLNPDFEAALEALRPASHFNSFLGPVMREHVALMQALGYRYKTQEERLRRLDRFLRDRPDLSGHPLTDLIREEQIGCQARPDRSHGSRSSRVPGRHRTGTKGLDWNPELPISGVAQFLQLRCRPRTFGSGAVRGRVAYSY